MNQAHQKIFVTTSIPYVNAQPHIGHAQEFVIADVLARLFKAGGHTAVYQTGADENSLKNVLAAKAEGLSTQEFVDRNSGLFKALVTSLGIQPDKFIRTTSPEHQRGVEAFWNRLKPEDLYEKEYRGLYCVGCEDFYLGRDLVGGLCPDHQTAPTLIQETNVFFRLSAYQRQIEELIATGRIRIYPEVRRNEALSFVRQGLHDISVSRSKTRAQGWGIEVPGAPDQVIYVWIDALINYLTGQGFGTDESWRDVWNEQTRKIHVIGKNVWKFHAVYWPALLLSAGLPLPDEIFVHGFLTVNGTKISKSLGNGVDPQELLTRHSADSLRHYLLHGLSIFIDSDFSEERLLKAYTNDLADRLGNLVSRLLALKARAGLGAIAIVPTEGDAELRRYLEACDVQAPIREAWQVIDRINAEINDRRPWEFLKTDRAEEARQDIGRWVQALADLLPVLSAVTPQSGEKLRSWLREGATSGILFPKSSVSIGQD